MKLKILKSELHLEQSSNSGSVTLIADDPMRPDHLVAPTIVVTLPLGTKAALLSLKQARQLLEETARNSVNLAPLRAWVEAHS